LWSDQGKLVGAADGTGAVERYTHDEVGRQLTHVDGFGQTTRWEWGPPLSDQLLQRYFGEAGPRARINALGERTAYAYDDSGKLSATTYPDGSVAAQEIDGAGRLRW